MHYIHPYHSPIGDMTLASDGNMLLGLWFDGQKYFGSTLSNRFITKDLPIFEQTIQWLDIYFSGNAPSFTPPLLLQTTSFRKAVWEILLTIPFGLTLSYGEIASQIALQKGLPHMSAQAVGAAIGHNPISLIVPCHRVVGANGNLTGYAGGIEKKALLLAIEKTV